MGESLSFYFDIDWFERLFSQPNLLSFFRAGKRHVCCDTGILIHDIDGSEDYLPPTNFVFVLQGLQAPRMLRHRKFNSCSLQELDREFQESSRRIEASCFEGCGGWRARVAASEAAASADVSFVALMMTAVLATSSLVIS